MKTLEDIHDKHIYANSYHKINTKINLNNKHLLVSLSLL